MRDLTGRKLLILGGIPLTNEIIKYAKRLNLDVYVTDYLVDSPAKKNADKSFMTSTTDVDAVVELIKQEKVDGTITGFVDLLLPYYHDICIKSGLPCYATKEQFKKLIDKVSFKQLCRDFGIPVVEEYKIDDISDINTINNLPYPILLKPADNSGGRGITICKTADEFIDNYNKTISFSKSKQVVVEKYMKTKEVSIFYVLQNGDIKLTAMGDRHIQHFKEGVIPLPVAYTFPSVYLKEYEKTIHPKVVDMFTSLGMKNGMVFIQSFVEDGKCIFYEMGYRLTGSLEYKIIEHASGYNPLSMMIEHAVTGETNVDLNRLANPHFENKYCNITFLVEPGKIKAIEGIESIKKMPNVLDIFTSYNNGDEIPESAIGTLKQVVARVFAYGSNNEELSKVMDEVHAKLKVTSIEGRNMLLPHFDTNKIEVI